MSVEETTTRNGKIVKIVRVDIDDSRTVIFSEKEPSIGSYVFTVICLLLPVAIVLIWICSTL